MDVLAALVAALKPLGVPVYTNLPRAFEAKLPALNVVEVAPITNPGLNGLGVDTVDVDVEVFASPADYKTGKAVALAARVRRHLFYTGVPGAVVVDIDRGARRPDKNPAVTCIALTARLRVIA